MSSDINNSLVYHIMGLCEENNWCMQIRDQIANLSNRLQAHDLADRDGLTLVSESETTKLRILSELLDSDGEGELDTNNTDSAHAEESRVLLLHLTLLVKFGDEGLDGAVGGGAVKVRDALVTRGKNGDVLGEVSDHELSLDDLRAITRGRGRAENVTDGNLFFFDTLEADDEVLTGGSLGDKAVLDLDGGDGGLLHGGQQDDLIAGTKNTTLELTEGLDAAAILVLGGDGEAHGLVVGTGEGRHVIEDLEERLTLVPGANIGGNAVLDVRGGETGSREESEIILLITELGESSGELLGDVVVTLLRPSDGGFIHLVDHDKKLVDTEGLGEHHVLVGLSTLIETSFELTLTSGNNKATNIGLSGTSDHRRNIRLVTGSIKEGDTLLISREIGATALNSLTSSTLIFGGIHDIGEIPRLTVLFLCFALVLLNSTLINLTSLEKDLTGDGRLTSINVT